MDDQLARRLSRQLKILNIFLVFFALVFITVLITVGIFAYIALKEVRKIETNISNLQSQAKDTLDVKSNACDSSSGLSSLLKDKTSICN